MGIADVFARFTHNPDAPAKESMIALHSCRSKASGFKKSITSSAKIDTHWLGPHVRGVSSPRLSAKANSRCNGSIIRINSIGDSGSPCLKLLWFRIGALGTPLTRIRVDAVDSRPAIHAIHLLPKPRASKTSMTKGHWTVSNALDISNLIMIAGLLRECSFLAVPWTSMKLS